MWRQCRESRQNVPVVAIFSIWRTLTSDKSEALLTLVGRHFDTDRHFKGLRDDFPVGTFRLRFRAAGRRLLLPGYERQWLWSWRLRASSRRRFAPVSAVRAADGR